MWNDVSPFMTVCTCRSSFSKYFLSPYHVPETTLGTEYMWVSREDIALLSRSCSLSKRTFGGDGNVRAMQ